MVPSSTQVEPSSDSHLDQDSQEETQTEEQESSPQSVEQDHVEEQASLPKSENQVGVNDRGPSKDEFVDHEWTVRKIKASSLASGI